MKFSQPFLTTLLAALGSLLITACQPTYVANPSNIPLLTQNGEMQGGLSAGTNGFNLQGAWAPVEHVGVLVNASTFTVTDSLLEPDFRRSTVEVALGGWTRLSKYMRFEAFVGTGWGITGDFPQRDLYRKYFLQPNFGHSGRYCDLGFSPRLSLIQHNEQRGVVNPPELPLSSLFFEPTLQARAGYEEFKFQFQVGPSIPLGTNQLDFRRWQVSVGVNLTLGKEFAIYTYTPN